MSGYRETGTNNYNYQRQRTGIQMKSQFAPQTIILFAVLPLLAVFASAIYLATSTPWLGLELRPSPDGSVLQITRVDPRGPATRLSSGEHLLALNGMVLRGDDLMEEPDALSRYADYNAFLARQQQIALLMRQPSLSLTREGGAIEVIQPTVQRPLQSLSWLFWYQLVCGAIVFLAGISVWAFRPRETVTLYYAMTGFGLLIAASSAAVYSTRELALDGDIFYVLSLSNQLGSLVFSGFFISILWYYPQRLHPFPLGPVFIGYYLLSWLLNLFQVSESLDVAMRLPLFVGLAINLALAFVQWQRSRSKPVQRAILKWFLLAWLSGTTIYVGLRIIPLMLGMDSPISQSLGWGILLTVYLGVALGITRYRLFNLDRWVVTGWMWFLGGVAVLLLDALLVVLLDLSNQLAMVTALALAGWVYFPIRQLIWARYSGYYRRKLDSYELLPSLLGTVLHAHDKVLPQEWQRLLERTFSPLHIETVATGPRQVEVDTDGSEMQFPAVPPSSALSLRYADRGGRLFNEEDRRLAESMFQLFSRVQSFREAFNDGVREERRRVARDLHDDVGARLLTLVYAADTEEQADLARDTLQELRDVIRNLEHSDYALVALLGELQRETLRRCEAHAVQLQWLQQDEIYNYPLAARQHSNLQRMMREVISNTLRHSDADQLQVEISEHDQHLTLRVNNNTQQKAAITAFNPGRGMRNIRSRAEELGGNAEWLLGEYARLGGCTVTITIPFERQTDDE